VAVYLQPVDVALQLAAILTNGRHLPRDSHLHAESCIPAQAAKAARRYSLLSGCLPVGRG
jgi:hypothetical protein